MDSGVFRLQLSENFIKYDLPSLPFHLPIYIPRTLSTTTTQDTVRHMRKYSPGRNTDLYRKCAHTCHEIKILTQRERRDCTARPEEVTEKVRM